MVGGSPPLMVLIAPLSKRRLFQCSDSETISRRDIHFRHWTNEPRQSPED
jgi:hypothetical protein